MQKAIVIGQDNPITRILIVTDISAVDSSPNGMSYIPVEWVDSPSINEATEIAYPMYNCETETMFWQVVEYQASVSNQVLENLNLKAQINFLNEQLNATKEELAITQEALDGFLGVSE